MDAKPSRDRITVPEKVSNKRGKFMKRRLSYLVTLVAGVLLLVPIALAQGQDQTMQPVPQEQTVPPAVQDQSVPPAAQDQSVQPVPIQDVVWVSITDNLFDVADIDIKPGTTVYWSNDGQVPHTVTADDGSFDSGQLNPGDSYIVTFLGSGVVSYHCELHPEMVGSVTVGRGDSIGGNTAPTDQVVPTGEALPTSEAAPAESQYSDEATYEDLGHAIIPTDEVTPTNPRYSDTAPNEDPKHAIIV